MASILSYTHAGATLVAELRNEGTGIGPGPFLLIHGIGMGRSVFTDLISHLDDAAPVVAVDLPGYGEASPPVRVLTMERTADLLAAFLEHHIRVPVVAIGHSMGSQIVVELAARHPSLVSHVVLVGPTIDPEARSALRQIWRLARDLIDESPRVIAIGAREYMRAGPRLLTKFRAMMAHRPERAMPRVTAPTLVVRGEYDLVAPRRWCTRITELIPAAKLTEIPHHGHETMIRDAAPAVARILPFVAR